MKLAASDMLSLRHGSEATPRRFTSSPCHLQCFNNSTLLNSLTQGPRFFEHSPGGGDCIHINRLMHTFRLTQAGIAILAEAIHYQVADFIRIVHAFKPRDVTAFAPRPPTSAAARRVNLDVGQSEEFL